VDTKSVILQTIQTFKELPIAEDDKTGKPVAVIKPKEAEAEEENEDFATFRINMSKVRTWCQRSLCCCVSACPIL